MESKPEPPSPNVAGFGRFMRLSRRLGPLMFHPSQVAPRKRSPLNQNLQLEFAVQGEFLATVEAVDLE